MATVCLCGSARFEAQFKEASKRLGLLGHVVIGLSSYPSENNGDKNWYGPDEKEMLDLVHLEKIRLADCVLVIDGAPTFETDTSHDPYVGFSTAREILWARMQERPVISLLSASDWDNVDETIRNRWDETYMEFHKWLVPHASQALRINHGKEVLADQLVDNSKTMMQATLSVIHCQSPNTAGSSLALAVLEALNLDCMDDRDVELALTGVVGIPADWCGLRPHDPKDLDNTYVPSTSQINELQEMVGLPLATVRKWRSELMAAEIALSQKGNKTLVRETLSEIVKDLAPL